MKNRILNYMKQFHMVMPGDRIVVGLSGGADSVFLLCMLIKMQKELDISLEAIHFHHGLRAASDQEEQFVINLCQQWNIPCTTRHLDVTGYAAREKLGIEEAARILRYEAFECQIKEHPGTKIALAHHKNDQAETVLYQMVRGSDVKGLMGIHPVRDCYIRPLLSVTRSEIEDFLKEHQISYVTDESNADDTYSRNYIRNRVIPGLKEHINERAVEHIADVSEAVAEIIDFTDQMVETYWENDVKITADRASILRDTIESLHPFLQKELIYKMMCQVAGRKKDISRVHVNEVMELLNGQSGRTIDLIYGMQAMADQQFLIIATDGAGADSEIMDRDITSQFQIRTFPYEKTMIIPEDRYTKWLDYDKMGKQLEYRYRQSQDFIFVGPNCKKRLKNFFVDEKIPLSQRNNVPLVADRDSGEIYWIVGYRINHNYKITEDTKTVLEITFLNADDLGGEHGR